MMKLFAYAALCFVLTSIVSSHSAITSLCAGKNVTSTFVRDYCESISGYLILRCCRSNDNQSFVAIDLMESDYVHVPNFTDYTNFDLRVIDLRSNPQLTPSRDDDFLQLTNLRSLVLPQKFPCPGGERVWEIINKTTDPVGNLCINQTDFCLNTTDVCVDEHSYCTTNGPDHYLCLCKQDHHGYKCLRHGEFPSVPFFVSTSVLTVVFSAFLYWTQRRHVKK